MSFIPSTSGSQIDQPHRSRELWLLTAIGVLMLIAGPLFVCMPVNSDTALYDVQASRIIHGGVLYRDVVEPNLPGVVWIHLAVRQLLGWSSEVMRVFDLLMLAGTALVFSRMLTSRLQSSGYVLAVLLFYLSCNEWCHCQRDVWMLLPVSLAVWMRLRKRSAARLANMAAVAEGFLWGVAFWIKPHVAIPAIAVIGTDIVTAANRSRRCIETLFVIGGGLLAALPGVAWLVSTGAWEHFWEMMLEWNPEYMRAGRERQSLYRWTLMFRRFYPWWFVHLVAVPTALLTLKNRLNSRQPQRVRTSNNHSTDASMADQHNRSQTLLAALYVGWLVQSLALQHAMDYIHVPAIILGMLLLVNQSWMFPMAPRKLALGAFLLLALINSPMLRTQRLAMWTTCWTEGSSSKVRATLAHGNFPQWNDIEAVTDFLKQHQVADGELTCVNVHSVHLFRELDVQPATRYWCMSILQELFPSRSESITRTVQQSATRFIVTEARESGVHNDGLLPSAYPWNLPVVFQSGSYRVHAVAAVRSATTTHQESSHPL